MADGEAMSESAPEVRPVVVGSEPEAPQPGWRQKTGAWVASHQPPDQAPSPLLPKSMPRFLANRQTVPVAWLMSMAILSWDDWHNNHILPRPSRLWSATWFYLILILISFVDALVPLANAFAIGYTITLAWQYFQGSNT